MTDSVTVVIPTRNRSDLLRTTLQSVLSQRDVHLHVIVIDEASTDDTGAVTMRFGDPRVRIVRHGSPVGVSAARNRGISEAVTDWVAFCDDDDVWSPDKLRLQLAAARSAGRAWAYTGCVHVNDALIAQMGAPPLQPDAMSTALRRYNAMPAGASNVMVRADVLRRVGGFDPTLTHVPDWDLWLRLSNDGLPACVPEPLVGYRIHSGNASFRTEEMLAEFDGLARRHGLAAERGRFHRHLAYLCLRSGRRAEALSHLGRALLRFRDGYRRADLMMDGRLLREHAAEIARRRLGWTVSPERIRAARDRDVNRNWKAQAQAWLSALDG